MAPLPLVFKVRHAINIRLKQYPVIYMHRLLNNQATKQKLTNKSTSTDCVLSLSLAFFSFFFFFKDKKRKNYTYLMIHGSFAKKTGWRLDPAQCVLNTEFGFYVVCIVCMTQHYFTVIT